MKIVRIVQIISSQIYKVIKKIPPSSHFQLDPFVASIFYFSSSFSSTISRTLCLSFPKTMLHKKESSNHKLFRL